MKKLVRDRIPAMAGKPVTIAGKDEYARRLADKLVEEAKEFQAARRNADRIEELADVLEVIDAICELYGFDKEEVEVVQGNKKDRKGGFAAGYVMEVPDPRRKKRG